MFYFRLKECVDFETLEKYGFHRNYFFYYISCDDYIFAVEIETRKIVFTPTPNKLMFLDVFYKIVRDGLVEIIEK